MNDLTNLQLALQEARKCKRRDSAYAVGCVIFKQGVLLGKGYSGQGNPKNHAEENALQFIAEEGCTLYTTMEPCSNRNSHTLPCTELILSKKIARVVFGCTEPPLFQQCQGVKILKEQEVKITQLKELAPLCLDVALSKKQKDRLHQLGYTFKKV